MTVCNRSNDAIWGMMGANVVHMTLLHELVAHAVGKPMGKYRVYTNNLHIYTEMPRFEEIFKTSTPTYRDVQPIALLAPGEEYEKFLADCEWFVKKAEFYYSHWFRRVAWPMYCAYLDKEKRDGWINNIKAPDWRIACQEWAERRKK